MKDKQKKTCKCKHKKGRDTLPSRKLGERREAAMMEGWKEVWAEKEKLECCTPNLPHTGSATGSARAGLVWEQEVVLDEGGSKSCRGFGVGSQEAGCCWGWLVENLQSTHRHPHVSRERLVHGRVVQRQEYRHIWLQEGKERARVILKTKKKKKKEKESKYHISFNRSLEKLTIHTILWQSILVRHFFCFCYSGTHKCFTSSKPW